jgi:hypothetical protein
MNFDNLNKWLMLAAYPSYARPWEARKHRFSEEFVTWVDSFR